MNLQKEQYKRRGVQLSEMKSKTMAIEFPLLFLVLLKEHIL